MSVLTTEAENKQICIANSAGDSVTFQVYKNLLITTIDRLNVVYNVENWLIQLIINRFIEGVMAR